LGLRIRIAIEREFGDILDMKKLSFVLFSMAFCVSVQAQAVKPVSANVANSSALARAEFMNSKYWTKIGGIEDKERGFVLFSRNHLPNPEGQIELWVKIIPNSPAEFNRHYDLSSESAFVLQYATVDCTKNFLLLDRTAVYDANNTKLGSGSSSLTPKSSRDRVKPGSIGGEIFQAICVKLAA
jgi:hypothetical protein